MATQVSHPSRGCSFPVDPMGKWGLKVCGFSNAAPSCCVGPSAVGRVKLGGCISRLPQGPHHPTIRQHPPMDAVTEILIG